MSTYVFYFEVPARRKPCARTNIAAAACSFQQEVEAREVTKRPKPVQVVCPPLYRLD